MAEGIEGLAGRIEFPFTLARRSIYLMDLVSVQRMENPRTAMHNHI